MSETFDQNSKITQQVFDNLVRLAALELEPEEAQYLLGELNGQLNAIRDLELIELDDELEITSHGVPYPDPNRPALREDRALPSDLADAIISQAPELEERYIVVPDIPRTELE